MTATQAQAPRAATNIASRILEWTAATPERTALVVPTRWREHAVTAEEVVTYGDLGRRVAAFGDGLARHGIGRGDRVVLLFPVSVDLFALALATLASGAVLTFVDTSMRPGRIRAALRSARPAAIVTVARMLRLGAFVPEVGSIPLKVSVDAAVRGAVALDDLRGDPGAAVDIAAVSAHDEALVTFTSGSTGRPKGADRNHGVLAGQLDAVMAAFPGSGDDVDLAVQPIGALADLAVGATCLLAPMDYRDPASLDAAVALDYMNRWGVTRLGAAPHFLDSIEARARESATKVPTLRYVFSGGAPVAPELCARILGTFPDTEGIVAYAATEAEPIATCSFAELVASTGTDADTGGYLVGRPVPEVRIVLAGLPDGLERLGPDGFAPYSTGPGEVGEVVVSGPQVVTRYVDADAAARATKIRDDDGAVWHRTGDLGRMRPDGNLELVGRTADVVHTATGAVLPYPVEREVTANPGVAWAALVAHAARPTGELLVVAAPAATAHAAVAAAAAVLARHEVTGVDVVAVPTLELDTRHLSKLDRPEIRRTRVAQHLAAVLGLGRVPGAVRLARLLPDKSTARLVSRLERTTSARGGRR